MPDFNPQFKKIGEVLVYNEVITEDQLNKALLEQKTTKGKLGNVLIKLGYISENDLTDAYSQQMGYKIISSENILKANLEVTNLLSEDFAKEKKVIALTKSDTAIAIAMEDPEDLATLDSIKKLTKLTPEILIASKSDISESLEILYDKIKQSDEVQSAISNISIIRGDEEDGDELDLATEKVSAEDAPFVKLVNLILSEAIKEGSTDIHIEPGRDDVNVRIRIDGILI